MLGRKALGIRELVALLRAWITLRGYKPMVVKVRCTLRCNSRCLYCSVGQGRISFNSNEMRTEDFFVLFDELKHMGTKMVDFTGGEPSLRTDLPQLVSYAREHGFSVGITTNGVLLTKGLAEKLIKANVNNIYLSIDSAHPQVHDLVRGAQGSWKTVTNGLQQVDMFRKKLKTNTKISIITVVSKINFKDLDSIFDMKRLFDFDEVLFIPLIEYFDSTVNLRLSKTEITYFNKNVARSRGLGDVYKRQA